MGRAPALEADQREVEMATMAGNSHTGRGKEMTSLFPLGNLQLLQVMHLNGTMGAPGEEDKGQK